MLPISSIETASLVVQSLDKKSPNKPAISSDLAQVASILSVAVADGHDDGAENCDAESEQKAYDATEEE